MPRMHPATANFGPTLALMGATVIIAATALVGTPALVHGQTMSDQPTHQTAHPTKAATSTRAGSVEERIAQLHAELKITSKEESDWNGVAQAMRDNAANMEKLVAEKHDQAPQNMTAVDDLKTYREFAQAHVDGLKNLTSAFETLYGSMPDAQKKLADHVFQNFWRERSHMASRQG